MIGSQLFDAGCRTRNENAEFKRAMHEQRGCINKRANCNQTNQLSLLTWSPYPGVSTMFSLSLTPFSTITVEMNQADTIRRISNQYSLANRPAGSPEARLKRWLLPWETGCISVVCRTSSSAANRPFESTKCDAKSVLINVDFPKPV